MAPVTHPWAPASASWGTNTGSDMYVIRGQGASAARSQAVIALHGYSGGVSSKLNLAQWLPWRFHSLTATGRTVICPHTTDGWGNSTAMGHIDNAVATAVALGFTDPPHFLGFSMGAFHAWTWAIANPADFASVFCVAPVHDMAAMYDQAGFTASMNTAWGVANRADLLTATAGIDLVRNRDDLAAIGDRCAAFSARDDSIIRWSGLEGLCEDAGITLTASAPEGESGGDHLFWELAQDWDEYLFIRHFDAHEI